jgi:multidrug efflux pump subunit AcrB
MFAQVPGIMQNQHNWGEKLIKFVIDIDQDKARRLDMSSQDLAQTLSAYFDGFEISAFRDADQTIPIMLRSAERDRNSVGDLLDITLTNGGTDLTPVEQLAVLKPQLEHSQIRRLDQVRTITITGKSANHTAEELYAAIKPGLDAFDLEGGYNINIGGEIETSKEIYGKLGAGLPYAFLLMILAVVYQFNSLRRALVIFMTVPLALVGVPIGLVVTGEPMSFFAMLGLISLAGIIINNAIVLVDQIDIEIVDKPITDAIRIAGMKRLRPVLLTSITTVIGLAPLYFTGGALWSPLAAVMMFGLAFASVLTLFFVPASYMLFFRRKYADNTGT